MNKKRLLILITAIFCMTLFSTVLFAQDADAPVTEEINTEMSADAGTAEPIETVTEEEPFSQAKEMNGFESLARSVVGSGFVDMFLAGGFAMWPILILLIWALAVIIWKITALNYAKVNVNSFLEQILPLIRAGKIDEAIKISEEARGPIAVILEVGLKKANKGVEATEKAIESAAGLEMAYLDKGFVALGTTITLAPMFGFFGTLVGMIEAFKAIAAAGEVDPTIVASGIMIALITSAAGLAVAIPVQFFNNIFQTMVDGVIIDMQKASEAVVETLVEAKGE